MVNRRTQNVLMRVMAAVMSLSLLFGITSCDALMEEMLEAYESATGETSEESGQEVQSNLKNKYIYCFIVFLSKKI